MTSHEQTQTLVEPRFEAGDAIAVQVRDKDVALNEAFPVIEVGCGWIKVHALANTKEAQARIVEALSAHSSSATMRAALVEARYLLSYGMRTQRHEDALKIIDAALNAGEQDDH